MRASDAVTALMGALRGYSSSASDLLAMPASISR